MILITDHWQNKSNTMKVAKTTITVNLDMKKNVIRFPSAMSTTCKSWKELWKKSNKTKQSEKQKHLLWTTIPGMGRSEILVHVLVLTKVMNNE